MDLRTQRRCFSNLGWTLLIYYGIMNAAVLSTCFADVLVHVVKQLIGGKQFNPVMLYGKLTANLSENGWGYLLAIGMGTAVALAWKGLPFFRDEVFAKNKQMTAVRLAVLMCFCLSTQAAAQLILPLQEWVLNRFGLSIMAGLESATDISASTSMYLYAALLGPIAEEVLFRGLIMRTLKPFGKCFAIAVSALLFSMFHGNPAQIPFAFGVGLVLGYTAMEYNIYWAIGMHIFNNMILSDWLSRLAKWLPALGSAVYFWLLGGAAIAALVLTLLHWKRAAAYVRENPTGDQCIKSFLTAPGILVFLILMSLQTLMVFWF